MCEEKKALAIRLTAAHVKKVLNEKLSTDKTFTGKIVVEIHCSRGNVSNSDAYIMKKFDTTA